MAVEADTIVVEGIEKLAGESPAGAPAKPPAAAAVENAFADDDAELARIQALADAEVAGTGKPAADAAGTPAAEAPAAAAPASEEPAKPAAPQPAAKPNPVAALQHALAVERGRRRQAENNANQLAGQVQVLAAVAAKEGVLDDASLQAAGLKETPKPKPPQERLADIEDKIIQLEQDYEDGTKPDLTAAEKKRQELALMRQREVVVAEIQEQQRPAQHTPATDLGLEEHLETLLVTYPVLGALNEKQLQPIEALAHSQAEAEGKPIADGPLGTKDLRERMGKLAVMNYPQIVAQLAANAPPAAQPHNGGAPPAKAPELSAEALQRKAKLELAAGHPPNVSTVGASAPGGQINDEQALQTLNSFGGDDDAAIRFLDANPALKARLGV